MKDIYLFPAHEHRRKQTLVSKPTNESKRHTIFVRARVVRITKSFSLKMKNCVLSLDWTPSSLLRVIFITAQSLRAACTTTNITDPGSPSTLQVEPDLSEQKFEQFQILWISCLWENGWGEPCSVAALQNSPLPHGKVNTIFWGCSIYSTADTKWNFAQGPEQDIRAPTSQTQLVEVEQSTNWTLDQVHLHCPSENGDWHVRTCSAFLLRPTLDVQEDFDTCTCMTGAFLNKRRS